jgi:hypothetical protein
MRRWEKSAGRRCARSWEWSIPFTPQTWYAVVLSIKVSSDVKQGYVEWWYDGEPQQLANGSTRFVCRTWDGTYSDPKWGVYGASGSVVTNYVTSLRIGIDYASVAPDGSSSASRRYRLRPRAEAARFFDVSGREGIPASMRETPRVFLAAP